MNANKTIALRFLVIALLVGGCATLSPVVKDLTPVEPQTSFFLTDKISYVTRDGAFEQGLLPGEYVSYKENALGVFFRGPSPTFWHKHSNRKEILFHDGGVWFPKSPDANPRIYTDLSGTSYTADSVDAIANNPSIPGQAGQTNVMANAVGGAIGSAIVTYMDSASSGEMAFTPEFSDAGFIEKIREAESKKVERVPRAKE